MYVMYIFLVSALSKEQTNSSFHTITLKLFMIQNYRLTFHNMHIYRM